jgi:Zn-dependent protease
MNGPTRLGQIGGFEVTADWSVAVSCVLVTGYLAIAVFPSWQPQWPPLYSLLTAFGTSVLLVASVLVRELAQALIGRSGGADIHTLELFPFGGIPHTSLRPVSPGTELRMAAAGPVVSYLLGMFSFSLASTEATPGSTILVSVGWINVALCAINLLPGYPLDGGRALRVMLRATTLDRNRATQISCRVGQACGWALILSGIGASFGMSLPVLGSLAVGPWLMLTGWFLIRAALAGYRSMLLVDICRELAALDALIDVPVTKVMSRVPAGMQATDELGEARSGFPSEQALLPIETEGRFLGWVRREDLVGLELAELERLRLAELMIPVKYLPTVRPEQTIAEAVTLMNRCCLDHIPVLTQERLIGIVSREDVVTWLCREAQAIRIDRAKSKHVGG